MTDTSAGSGIVGSASVEVRATVDRLRRDLNESERITRQTTEAMQRSANRSGAAMGRAMGDFKRETQGANQELMRLNATLGSAVALIAGAGGLAGAAAIIRLADQYTNLSARIRLVLDATDDFAKVQADLFRIAQQTRAPIEDITNLYTRLRSAIADLGDAEAQGIATVLAQSLAISGASASETAAFLRQISQALASGVLRGDEFNSVMENNSRFAALLAEQLGVGVGELRSMAEQGRLTATVIRDAIAGGADGLAAEFASMPVTVAGALQQVQNALARYVGETDQALGASARLAGGLQSLAENFDEIADAVVIAGAAILASLAGRGLQAGINGLTAAMGRAALATQGLAASARASAVAAGLAGTAWRGLSALLGGPLGIALTGITLAFFAFQQQAERAARASVNLEAALAILASAEPAAEGAATSADAAAQALEAMSDEVTKAADETEKLARFTQQAADATQTLNAHTGRSIGLTDARARATAALAEVQRLSTLATVQQALAEQREIQASAQSGIRGRANESARLAARGMLNPQVRQRFLELDAADREALESASRSIELLAQGLEDLRAGRIVIPAAPTALGGGGSGGTGRLGESDAERAQRRAWSESARLFERNLTGDANPILAIQALDQARAQFDPEEIGAIIESILRLPGALGGLDQITDPIERLDEARRILAQIRFESGNLSQEPIFDTILGDLSREAGVAYLQEIASGMDQFADATDVAREAFERISRNPGAWEFLGGAEEQARGAVHYLVAMAEAAGDAREALQLLNASTLSGIDRNGAERQIRDAAREGYLAREEQLQTLWRVGDFRDAIADGLFDAFRTGNWREAFAQSLQSVLQNVMRRMAESFANWIADAMIGAMPGGGGGGGWLGSILGAVGGLFSSGGGVSPGRRANGGKVSAGMPYIVNEPGAKGELFIPGADGYVASNRALKSAAGAGRQQVELRIKAVTDGSVNLRIEAAKQEAIIQGARLGAQSVSKTIVARSTR